MTPSEKYLTPHNLFKEESFDEHCSKMPELFFKKEVPEDVIKNFEVIEQLLAHSYFQYRFIDEAYTKALQTFEMAMDIRHKELTNSKKDLDFASLIQRLTNLNQFDTNIETLKHFKWMRNYYSHPKRHSFGGVFMLNKLDFLIFLINEMYKDTALRIERRKLESTFLASMKRLKLDMHLIMEVNHKKIEVYRMQLLFIDNKENPHQHHFSYTPLFDLTSKGEMDILSPNSFSIVLIEPTFNNGILIGNSIYSNHTIKFYPIEQDAKCYDKFLKWSDKLNCKTQKNMYEFSLVSNNNDLYGEAFWEFLKK